MKNEITFSQKVKNEILANERINPCCYYAYLSAIIRGNGSLSITNLGLGFALTSTNLDLLKYVAILIKNLYNVDADIVYNNKGKKPLYTMDVTNKQVLFDCGILTENNGLIEIVDGIDPKLITNDCCKRSYVKGLFLACGSVIAPDISDISDDTASNTKYHLEFQLNSNVVAGQLVDMLAEYEFYLKITEHHGGSAVYLKDAEAIADMLVFLGANKAKLWLENIIITRNVRNVANRQSNCINANIDRAILASEKQINAITKIIEHGKMGLLDVKLQESANARMDNPDANLDELATMLNITKSGINHRLRKLVEIANDIED